MILDLVFMCVCHFINYFMFLLFHFVFIIALVLANLCQALSVDHANPSPIYGFTGQIVTVTCDAGYSVAGTAATVTCTPSGNFTIFIDGEISGTLSCNAVSCPESSAGSDVPSGCTCNPGYSGSVSAEIFSPYYHSTCMAVRCPSNSVGNNVPTGCTCTTGYSGNITPSGSVPFYTGTCIATSSSAPRIDSISATTLVDVNITGTSGEFSCASTQLSVGQTVVISGSNQGTGSITGYSSPTTYYIIATNNSSTFTLSLSSSGSGVDTSTGTPIGLIYDGTPTGITPCSRYTDLRLISCPRTGGINLTINGANFVSPIVYVGYHLCSPTIYGPTKITCTLQAGTGLGVPVNVIDNYMTVSGPTIDYAFCRAGEESLDDTSACIACSAGKFSLGDGAMCASCTPGNYSGSGSAVCSSCAPGRYSNSINPTVCAICAIGTYSNATTGFTNCTACPQGNFGTTNGSCALCEEGRYAGSKGLSACLDCPSGSMQNESGKSSCFGCEPGLFQALTGQSACTACAAGSFSFAGQAQCTPCEIGRFQLYAGGRNCTVCVDGKFADNTGLSSCIDCSSGTFSNSATTKTACARCSLGSAMRATMATSCSLCDVGKFAGSEGTSVCEACAAGTYAASLGLSACVSCDSGRYTNETGQEVCKLCPRGKFRSLNDPTTGTTGTTSSNWPNCEPCEMGKYSDENGAILCSKCPSGRYQSELGSSSCLGCSSGYVADDVGFATCSICLEGKFEIENLMCGDCEAGKIQPNQGQNICNECPAGTFQAETGKTNCMVCPLGKISNPGTKYACDECASEIQFQPFESSSRCFLCPNHAQHTADRTSCLCDQDFYGVTNTLTFAYVDSAGYRDWLNKSVVDCIRNETICDAETFLGLWCARFVLKAYLILTEYI
jgi:hypothetical protein